MIELPVTFKMLSDLQSGTIDVVRADACKAYGDQRAAEAREQMREECVKELQGMTTNNATARSAIKQCAEALKELK